MSLNNNPTVQDLWNSTPAWSQPFIGSPAIQGPPITQIEGPMAQVVAGLTAYAYVDQSFYGEAGVYRSALQGQSVANNGNTTNNIISGVAPYWRFAYEDDWGNNSLEFGTLGLSASLQNPTTPAGNAINGSLQGAAVDRFLDAGLDSQYEYTDDDDQISVDARWIHEEETLDASFEAGFASNTKDHLDSFNLNGSYYWRRKFGLTLGLFDVEGSKDPVYFGNATGSPQTTWSMAEVDYLPWQNVKIGLQYNAFFTFDGRSSNYDGAGRNASDNNLLYGFLWLAF